MSTDLIKRLRSLSHGFEEWRVENPVDGSYCMSYTRDEDLSPEQAALGWLAEHLLRHPDSQFAGYIVKKHVVKTRKDQALDEAADALERLEAENARITECGRAHIRRAAALEEERDTLRGLKPEIPLRPSHNNDASYQHPALPRYGLRWNGPGQPVSVPMADGYWTPFHLALEALEA